VLSEAVLLTAAGQLVRREVHYDRDYDDSYVVRRASRGDGGHAGRAAGFEA
jgi:hypothetical protein